MRALVFSPLSTKNGFILERKRYGERIIESKAFILIAVSIKKIIAGFFIMLIGVVGFLWYVGYAAQHNKTLSFSQNSLPQNNGGTMTGTLQTSLQEAEKTNDFAKSLLSLPIVPDITETDSPMNAELAERLNDLGGDVEQSIAEVAEVRHASSELTILENGQDALRSYLFGISDVVQKYRYDDLGKEHSLMLAGLPQNIDDETKHELRNKLARIAETYKVISKELVAIPVPKEKAENLLALSNSFLDLSASTTLMQQALYDPVIALAATKLYLATLTSLPTL